jgi:hypothetical protein
MERECICFPLPELAQGASIHSLVVLLLYSCRALSFYVSIKIMGHVSLARSNIVESSSLMSRTVTVDLWLSLKGRHRI